MGTDVGVAICDNVRAVQPFCDEEGALQWDAPKLL